MKLRHYLTLLMLPSAILFVIKQKSTNQNWKNFSKLLDNLYIQVNLAKESQKQCKNSFQYVNKNEVFPILVSLILNQVMMLKNGKKDIFYDLR